MNNKAIQKLKKMVSLAIVLILFAMPCTAFAAEKGSLQIVLKKAGVQVVLYHVASADGILFEEFAGTEISVENMLNDKHGRKNAKTIYKYAQSKDIAGVVRTTDSNCVTHYTNLEKGIYVVGCADADDNEFLPFLVKVPTIINGEEQYYLKAKPKADTPDGPKPPSPEPDPEDPEVPEKPEDPEDPQIPVDDPDVPTTEPPEFPETPEDPLEDITDSDVPSHVLELDDPMIPQTGALRYPIWLLNGFGTLSIAAGILQLRKAGPEEFEDLDEEDMLDEEA